MLGIYFRKAANSSKHQLALKGERELTQEYLECLKRDGELIASISNTPPSKNIFIKSASRALEKLIGDCPLWM